MFAVFVAVFAKQLKVKVSFHKVLTLFLVYTYSTERGPNIPTLFPELMMNETQQTADLSRSRTTGSTNCANCGYLRRGSSWRDL